MMQRNKPCRSHRLGRKCMWTGAACECYSITLAPMITFPPSRNKQTTPTPLSVTSSSTVSSSTFSQTTLVQQFGGENVTTSDEVSLSNDIFFSRSSTPPITSSGSQQNSLHHQQQQHTIHSGSIPIELIGLSLVAGICLLCAVIALVVTLHLRRKHNWRNRPNDHSTRNTNNRYDHGPTYITIDEVPGSPAECASPGPSTERDTYEEVKLDDIDRIVASGAPTVGHRSTSCTIVTTSNRKTRPGNQSLPCIPTFIPVGDYAENIASPRAETDPPKPLQPYEELRLASEGGFEGRQTKDADKSETSENQSSLNDGESETGEIGGSGSGELGMGKIGGSGSGQPGEIGSGQLGKSGCGQIGERKSGQIDESRSGQMGESGYGQLDRTGNGHLSESGNGQLGKSGSGECKSGSDESKIGEGIPNVGYSSLNFPTNLNARLLPDTQDCIGVPDGVVLIDSSSNHGNSLRDEEKNPIGDPENSNQINIEGVNVSNGINNGPVYFTLKEVCP